MQSAVMTPTAAMRCALPRLSMKSENRMRFQAGMTADPFACIKEKNLPYLGRSADRPPCRSEKGQSF